MTLPAASEKRAWIERMFDRIAPRYDLVNRLMTFGIDRGWRRRTIAALDLVPGARVLDLACGTGDLALLARDAGASVVALDSAREMLRRADARGLRGTLVRGDALALPLGDGSCDAVVSGFALRNFVALEPALRECARVLRPGGRIGLLEVDEPPSALFRAGHRVYFNHVVPWVGGLFSDRGAYAYLPASVAYLPDETGFRDLLSSVGFQSSAKARLAVGVAQLWTATRAAASLAAVSGDHRAAGERR